MDVSVLIVTWNVADHAARCLTSLAAGLNPLQWEVIMVDNASTDGTAERIPERFPRATVIANSENRGFGAGINQAALRAKGESLFILNPDTEVAPGAGLALNSRLLGDAEIGAVGPRLLNGDGSRQSSRRRFPTVATGLFLDTPFEKPFGRLAAPRFHLDDRPEPTLQRVDWLVGAAFMTRRSIWDQIGGFDERFFLYFEEVDWFLRLKEGGYQAWFEPSATVVHHYGKSAEQNLGRRYVLYQDSKSRYYGKHFGAAAGIAMRSYLLACAGYKLAEEGAKWILGHQRPLRRRRISDLAAALRSGLRAR